jgi:hypothetical protein
VVDDILFFVDEGTSSVSGDTHPTLAMATYDPSSGAYDVQALVDEAEDFQVAYGVDGMDASTIDGGADPVRVDVTGSNKDEWIGNVAGESDGSLGTPAATIPRTGSVDAFLDRPSRPATRRRRSGGRGCARCGSRSSSSRATRT